MVTGWDGGCVKGSFNLEASMVGLKNCRMFATHGKNVNQLWLF